MEMFRKLSVLLAKPAPRAALTFSLVLSSAATASALVCGDVFRPPSRTARTVERPLAQNTAFELFRVSEPDGVERGELFHFRVREDMLKKISETEGAAFQRQSVAVFTDNPGLFTALGFKVSKHPVLGEYWSEFPSPELFNHRAAIWNREHAGEPKRQIHVRMETTGADAQIKMLKLWLDRSTIGVADPFNGFTEFYIPNGSLPPSPEMLNHVETVSTARGPRVREHNTLHRHDMDQVANAVFLNEAYLTKTRQVQKFWDRALEIVRGDDRLVESPRVTEFMRAFDGVTTHDGRRPLEGRSGMTPHELLRIYLHHGQRGLHSITHILSWLIKNPSGIEPATFRDPSRGVTFEIEASIHWAGLGRRAPGANPPGSAPNLLMNWARASETGPPLTLKSALDFTTNGEIRRIEEFAALVRDPRIDRLVAELRAGGELRPVSDRRLSDWTAEINDRYGDGMSSPRGDRP